MGDRDPKRSLKYLDSLSLDYSDPDWKSTYMKDYEGRRGIFAGLYTGDIRPAPIFPEDHSLNK